MGGPQTLGHSRMSAVHSVHEGRLKHESHFNCVYWTRLTLMLSGSPSRDSMSSTYSVSTSAHISYKGRTRQVRLLPSLASLEGFQEIADLSGDTLDASNIFSCLAATAADLASTSSLALDHGPKVLACQDKQPVRLLYRHRLHAYSRKHYSQLWLSSQLLHHHLQRSWQNAQPACKYKITGQLAGLCVKRHEFAGLSCLCAYTSCGELDPPSSHVRHDLSPVKPVDRPRLCSRTTIHLICNRSCASCAFRFCRFLLCQITRRVRSAALAPSHYYKCAIRTSRKGCT